jgi:CopG antitoxin of type II toxin-antitoxin system
MTKKEQAQPKIRKSKSRIPTFQTVEEEAAFWDSHSSEEFAEELTPVENVKFVKAGTKKALTVRFDEDTFEELSREAREKGIGPSTLARMVILEHLRARRAS